MELNPKEGIPEYTEHATRENVCLGTVMVTAKGRQGVVTYLGPDGYVITDCIKASRYMDDDCYGGLEWSGEVGTGHPADGSTYLVDKRVRE